MNILLAVIIVPFWIFFLLVQHRCVVLSKKLYILVNGTASGYSWRKFRDNIDAFDVPPHEELARKVKALNRLWSQLVLAFVVLSFIVVSLHELRLV